MKKIYEGSFEEVVSVENLCEAWREFIRGKSKKKDVQEFALRLGDEIADLQEDLRQGGYVHGSYAYFRVNDPKPRDIHKATVRDRLLHHALHRQLYPFFSKTFIADSYSCQKGKGLHRALDAFRQMAGEAGQNNSRTCWILKCDIRKFFASIDHGLLLGLLHERIRDVNLLRLLEGVIRSFEAMPTKSLPLGNLTSQLFANIYMNEFDQFVKQQLHIKHYIRYADDFVFLSEQKQALIDILPRLHEFLSVRLALVIHPGKIFIRTLASGVDFLGWTHFPHHRILMTRTKRRILKKNRLSRNNETLQSYLGMLRHGDTQVLQEILRRDYWLWNGGRDLF